MDGPSLAKHRVLVAGIVAGTAALAVAGLVTWLVESAHPAPGAAAPPSTTSTVPATGGPTTTGSPPATPGAGTGSDWTVYHGNALGTGASSASTSFDAATAAWSSPALDGQVYGEPLAWDGRVYVATENDTVYALAARTGSVEWSTHLATPVPSGDLPCGDITPTVGVTGTPVIDASRQEIFVVADELAGGTPSHRLVGLDAVSGKVLLDEGADPPGADPAAVLQRTGLALDASSVVWGYGGNYGDCGDYHGWVMSAPEKGGAVLHHEADATGGERQGAVWMGGAAPEVTATGDIWVAIGNGSVDSATSPYDGSDSVTELTPQLTVVQLFAPAGWASDNAHDRDLGSTAPALLADGTVLQVGKSQTAYLLSRAALGNVGGQLASVAACSGEDADGGDAVSGLVVYVPCDSGIEALRTTSSPPSVTVLWTAAAAPSGPPIVAGGLVWSVGGGTLYGIEPATGATAVHLPIGTEADHFPTPAEGDGLLLVPGGTDGDKVLAFRGSAGLPPPPTTASTG